jgi:hypothetical protein
MDLQRVIQLLRDNLRQGVLTVSGTLLESTAIQTVFASYLPGGTLTLTGVAEISDEGGYAQAIGTGPTGSPFAGMTVTAQFSTPGNVAQADLTATRTSGWTWATSFPALQNTILPSLAFSAPSLTLASQPPSPDDPGLRFTGQLTLGTEYQALLWLLDGSTTLSMAGPVAMDSGLPLPSLKATVSKGVSLGPLDVPFVDLLVGGSLVPAAGGDPASVLGYLGIGTEVDFTGNGIHVGLPLTSTFGPDARSVLLTVDLTSLGKLVNAGLVDLAALLGGQSFVNELKDVPLSTLLVLKSFAIQIDLSARTASSVRLQVGSTQAWPVLTERRSPAASANALFVIEEIDLVLALLPPTCSQSGVAIFGTMTLGGGTLLGSAIFPDFAFALELKPGTAIDLTQVIEHFLGTNPDIPALQIDELEILVDRAAQTYAGSFVIDSDWTIPLGSKSLTVQQIGVSVSRESGNTTGSLQGELELAGATIEVLWQIPGALQIAGQLPQASLTSLVNSISPTPLRSDFPTITLLDSNIYIERTNDGAYYLAAGTQVAGFGAFQVSFRDVKGQTGWVIGFVLEEHWSLANISSLFAPLSFISLQKAGLMYATMDDPNFEFRSFSDPSFTFPAKLPSAPTSGAVQGLSLFAELQLSGGPLDVIAKVLPGRGTLLLAATFAQNYAQTTFKAGITSPLVVVPGAVVFDDAYVSFAPGQEKFGLYLDATFTIHQQSISLTGDILVAPGVVTLELSTTKPWPKPFGIEKLTLDKLGVGISLGDELVLSLAGEVAIGQGAKQVILDVGVEFNAAEEGLPDVLLAEETGTISIADIVGTFTSTSLPAVLSSIELSDFKLLVVANPNGWNNPADHKHYDPGLAFGGTLLAFGVEASIAIQVSDTHGIFAKGEIDKPLNLDVLTIANATNPAIGPYLELNSANSPYLTLSAALTLFELVSYKVDAEVDSNGFHFNFSYTIGQLGSVSFAIALKNKSAFALAAQANFAVSNVGPIKAGSFSLGTLKVDLSLAAHFAIAADTGGNFALSLGATFSFEGVALRLDDLTITEKITSFSQLPKVFADNLAALLWDIAKSLLQDANVLFQLIGRGALAITDDIGHILHAELGLPIEKAAALLKSVSATLAYDARKVAALLRTGFAAADHEVAAAMRSAAYDVKDVADAVGHAFGEGAEDVAGALRTAGYQLSEVATALKDVFAYSANQVASFFKNTWHEADTVVNDALKAAQYLASEIDSAMKSIFGWVDHVIDKAKHALNPKNW